MFKCTKNRDKQQIVVEEDNNDMVEKVITPTKAINEGTNNTLHGESVAAEQCSLFMFAHEPSLSSSSHTTAEQVFIDGTDSLERNILCRERTLGSKRVVLT